MEIGLVDVDSHNFPNLALMKISAWHKGQGDNVEWAMSLKHYDILYKAKVFTFSKEYPYAWNADKIIEGGTGYSLDSKLPQYMESAYPDYSLYGITDTAYGYLSRGCPRGCAFCIVGEKEGRVSVKVANLREWWNGQKYIKLLDPNLLACPDRMELLGQLAESKAWVDYTQGLDIRLMSDELAEAINKTHWKRIHFAWDNPNDEIAERKLREYRSVFKASHRKLSVYVLTNFNTTHEEDMHRIKVLRELNYSPYVMIYDKDNAPQVTRHLQRWVNIPMVFWSEKDFSKFDAKKA